MSNIFFPFLSLSFSIPQDEKQCEPWREWPGGGRWGNSRCLQSIAAGVCRGGSAKKSFKLHIWIATGRVRMVGPAPSAAVPREEPPRLAPVPEPCRGERGSLAPLNLRQRGHPLGILPAFSASLILRVLSQPGPSVQSPTRNLDHPQLWAAIASRLTQGGGLIFFL